MVKKSLTSIFSSFVMFLCSNGKKVEYLTHQIAETFNYQVPII